MDGCFQEKSRGHKTDSDGKDPYRLNQFCVLLTSLGWLFVSNPILKMTSPGLKATLRLRQNFVLRSSCRSPGKHAGIPRGVNESMTSSKEAANDQSLTTPVSCICNPF